MKYTPKQIEKYNQQKYLAFLDKITKNLFKMFRNTNVTQDNFMNKFTELKIKFDKLPSIHLNSEYHIQTKQYIEVLYNSCKNEFKLDDIRDPSMTSLNRLQKLKNSMAYKKEKHKNKIMQDEDY